jgi:hypothetical protein
VNERFEEKEDFFMLDGLSHIDETFSPFCVTFARGLEEPEMLLRFGGDPSLAWPLPCGDILALQDLLVERDPEEFEGLDIFEETDTPVIQVGRCGDWVFAIEYYGWMHGLRPEVLRVVSAGTIVVSVSCDVNRFMVWNRAEDGMLVESSETWWEEVSTQALAIGFCLDRAALAKPLLTGMVDPLSQT